MQTEKTTYIPNVGDRIRIETPSSIYVCLVKTKTYEHKEERRFIAAGGDFSFHFKQTKNGNWSLGGEKVDIGIYEPTNKTGNNRPTKKSKR